MVEGRLLLCLCGWNKPTTHHYSGRSETWRCRQTSPPPSSHKCSTRQIETEGSEERETEGKMLQHNKFNNKISSPFQSLPLNRARTKSGAIRAKSHQWGSLLPPSLKKKGQDESPSGRRTFSGRGRRRRGRTDTCAKGRGGGTMMFLRELPKTSSPRPLPRGKGDFQKESCFRVYK